MTSSSRRRIRVVSAEISDGGRYLISQRMPTATLPLLWEFPGGRVREAEGDEAALQRALHDRLGVYSKIGERVLEVVHRYSSYDLTLAVYRAELSGCPKTLRVHALAWVRSVDLSRYEFPGADQQTVDLLLLDEG
jgi:8-oxo-dGTP diphosphatase